MATVIPIYLKYLTSIKQETFFFMLAFYKKLCKSLKNTPSLPRYARNEETARTREILRDTHTI
jgi:hypothetical protein